MFTITVVSDSPNPSEAINDLWIFFDELDMEIAGGASVEDVNKSWRNSAKNKIVAFEMKEGGVPMGEEAQQEQEQKPGEGQDEGTTQANPSEAESEDQAAGADQGDPASDPDGA
jgi:hypothetical protein